MSSFFTQSEHDIRLLTQLSSLNKLINSEDAESYESARAELTTDLLALVQSQDIYYQVRYINNDGKEVLRVDSIDGETFVVPDESLQDKNDRYYYTDTMVLSPGEVFVSPLDLNIEQGILENRGTQENPEFVPVVRYAMRVFDKNKNSKGMVITNVYAKEAIDSLNDVINESHAEHYVMIDSRGYFLSHKNSDLEWGFDRKTGENIEKYYPGVLSQLNARPKGNLYYRRSGDYFIFSHIKALSDDKDSIQSEFGHIDQAGSLPRTEQYWIIASILNRGSITSVINKPIVVIVIFSFFVFIQIFIVAWWLIRSISRPIKELEKGAEMIATGDLDYRLDLRGDHEIKKLAETFNSMTVAIKESRASIDKKVEDQTREITKKNEAYVNQQTALLNVLEDVEEEKEKVERAFQDLEKFKLATESATDAIVITDADARILYVNPAVERVTGFTQKECLGGKAGSNALWGGLMDDTFYKHLWNTVKVKKKPFIGDIKNKRKNGEVYDALARISPILDRNGRVIYFVALERDITKEKDIDRAKTEFVSLASHQLRTPLSAINWYTEMLLAGDAGKISKNQKEYLEEIYKGNQRMVGLVNALLNVSRIELGTFMVEPELIKLQDLADSVLSELKPHIERKGLRVKKLYAKELKEISVDPKLMRIVFQNYLSNAVKYTADRGFIHIAIKLIKHEVVISVKDSGLGIPSNQRDKIFTKLFRADNVRAADTEGTGLGLYIVKSIIEHSGGKVWFTSVENKGSTFYATLPKKGMQKKEGSRKLA